MDMRVRTPNDERILALNEGEREAFWAKVDRSNPDGCWPWMGGRSSNGYGSWSRVAGGGRTVCLQAHRVARGISAGELVSGMTIDHLCRNRACCNPAHLELVSMAENSRRIPRVTGQDGEVPHEGRDASFRERVASNGQARFQVRFRPAAGSGPQRSRTYSTRAEAEAVVQRIKLDGAQEWMRGNF